MKIGLISNWFPPENFGGSGMFLYHLSRELAARGHDVQVLYCRDSYRLRGRGRRQEGLWHDPRIAVTRLENPLGKWAPLLVHQTGRPLLNRRALNQFFAQEFDVIDFNNISLIGGPGIYRYGRGVKLVHLHDYWLLCPKSNLFRFNRVICRPPAPLTCLACGLAAGKPPQWWRFTNLLHDSLAGVDALIASADHIRDKLLQAGLKNRIITIPYGLGPLPAQAASDERPPQPGPYFLFCGQLEKGKGAQVLIRHFLGGEFGDLLIAGEGRYRRRLERMAGGSPRVRFLGYLEQDRVRYFYRHARALLVPSLWDEPFGITAADALAHGIPLIARDGGGPGEMVRASGGGLAYRSDAELRAAMGRLMRDETERRELGAAGRRYFAANFPSDINVGRYLGLIEELKRQKSPG